MISRGYVRCYRGVADARCSYRSQLRKRYWKQIPGRCENDADRVKTQEERTCAVNFQALIKVRQRLTKDANSFHTVWMEFATLLLNIINPYATFDRAARPVQKRKMLKRITA